MRYIDFKSVIREAATMAKARYYDDKSDYLINLRKAIDSEGTQPVTVILSKEKFTVTFTDDAKEIAKKLDAVKQDYEAGESPQWKQYPLKGITSDGEPKTFQFNNISKYLPSKDVNDDNPATAVNVNAGNVTEGVVGLAMATKFANTTKVITIAANNPIGEAPLDSAFFFILSPL